jgi:hypothetical protein
MPELLLRTRDDDDTLIQSTWIMAEYQLVLCKFFFKNMRCTFFIKRS